jgi:hypothetical protein
MYRKDAIGQQARAPACDIDIHSLAITEAVDGLLLTTDRAPKKSRVSSMAVNV